jgi:hypothetical protein
MLLHLSLQGRHLLGEGGIGVGDDVPLASPVLPPSVAMRIIAQTASVDVEQQDTALGMGDEEVDMAVGKRLTDNALADPARPVDDKVLV